MPADPISDALREWDQVRTDAEIDYPFLAQAMERLRALPAPVRVDNAVVSASSGGVMWERGWFYPDGGDDAG